MIIHSHEYFLAMKKEMEGFLDYVVKQKYGSDAVFLKEGIQKEIDFCVIAMENMNCRHCLHCVSDFNENSTAKEGGFCRLNGPFPSDMDCSKYKCVNWVYDDIPF